MLYLPGDLDSHVQDIIVNIDRKHVRPKKRKSKVARKKRNKQSSISRRYGK